MSMKVNTCDDYFKANLTKAVAGMIEKSRKSVLTEASGR
jgi:hypothetical protein